MAVNAAQAAFDLRQEVERAAKWEIEVLHGVFNLHNHQVSMPPNPMAPVADENVRLEYAPTNPRDFRALAVRMAEMLRPESIGGAPAVPISPLAPSPERVPANGPATG